jgi:hypothetical protein
MTSHNLTAATVAALVTVVAGCLGDGGPVAPDDGPSFHQASMHGAGPQRPLTGRCETTFDPPSFPPPPVFSQVDVGTCLMAHLGRAAFYSAKDINVITGTQITTEAIFTAANGDELHAVGSGTSQPAGPGQFGFSATLTFAGGTGRFTHAAGEAHVEGVAQTAAGTATLEIVGGWIRYGR